MGYPSNMNPSTLTIPETPRAAAEREAHPQASKRLVAVQRFVSPLFVRKEFNYD